MIVVGIVGIVFIAFRSLKMNNRIWQVNQGGRRAGSAMFLIFNLEGMRK